MGIIFRCKVCMRNADMDEGYEEFGEMPGYVCGRCLVERSEVIDGKRKEVVNEREIWRESREVA
jgi:hypothetical protein